MGDQHDAEDMMELDGSNVAGGKALSFFLLTTS
jgi:hypothetical protein